MCSIGDFIMVNLAKPEKKNQKVPSNGNKMDKLPESILLRIFYFVSLKDLGHASLVCRQWRRIAYDNTLWRNADLRGFNLKSDRILALIDRISPSVLAMNLNGCSIKFSLIVVIVEKCVNLRSLRLQGAHFTDLSHEFRPKNNSLQNLENLDLRFLYGDDCIVFMTVLKELKTIQCLGIDNIGSTADLDIIFASFSNLRIVHCQNCASFNDAHVDILARSCPNLESLCLAGCIYVTGTSFPRLLTECRRLKTLMLSCTRVRNQHLTRTDWGQARLTELDISYCYGIAESGLMELLPKLTGLRYLQLSFCGWGRALTDEVMNAMSRTQYKRLETLDVHSNFNITGETLCKFVRNSCPELTTLCVGSAINSSEELESLLKGLRSLKHFYITKQASIRTETVFDCVKRFCQHIETLALYNFYAVNRHRVEEALVELVSACRFLKVLCIRGTNVPLRTELAHLANKVKNATKRNDIEISRRPHFLLTGPKLCLDSVFKS